MADFTQEQLDEAIERAVAESTAALTLARDESEKGLKAKLTEVLAEKKAASEKAKEAQDKAVKAAEEAARKSGDVAALEKSWKEREDARLAEISERDQLINKMTVGAAVADISAQLAVKGSESAFAKIIRDRLGVEMRDGSATIRVMDANGSPSAMTIDDLKKELSADAALKPLLAGSLGSGGGAAGSDGGAGQKNTITREQWDKMPLGARSEFASKNGQVTD